MSELLAYQLQPRFGLSLQEARFVAALLEARSVPFRDQLVEAITAGRTEEPDIKIVDVVACRVRKKLKTFFETDEQIIETVFGRGYRIDETMKELLREVLAKPAGERAA